MSTNDKPAILSAERLAEIRKRVDAATPGPWTRKADHRAHFVGALDYLDTPSQVISASTYPGQEGMVFCSAENSAFIAHSREDVPALLGHVDALAAGAVDAEALGIEVRRIWIAWAYEQPNPKPSWLVPWEGLSEPDREVDRRIGSALHAIGYAAGAVAMTGEGDDPATEGAILILMKRHDAELWEARANGRSEEEAEHEAVRSDLARQVLDQAKELNELDVRMSDARAEIARLTAELVEARRIAEERQEEAIQARQLLRSQAATMDAEREEAIAAARADGARVEREACAQEAERRLIEFSEIDVLDKTPERLRIARRIRARGEGGPT